MLEVDLNANVRSQFGKGAARTLRREGSTPAILYGPKHEPMALKLETKPFTQTLLKLQRQNAVITLNIKNNDDESKKTVVLKEIQVDPVLDTLNHADFLEISLDSPITLSVQVKYSGTAEGVEAGGDFLISKDSVSVKGLPMDIPDFLEVDVTSLQLNQHITCKDLTIPENVTLQEKEDLVCAGITLYTEVEEEILEEEPEAEEAPEPEETTD
ncbi:MAG: 50S ribosomal protein L25 [Thermodesulfobacteriota bacterium]|nr:50S ribosomal protein L25 [Thermodesulfobacteriota bacterium]